MAVGLALTAALVGWRGVDLPAQLYRVTMFHRSGVTLWDPQWYGGHWAFDYSLAFPALAATIGVTVTATLSAGLAALAFDRLVTDHFGRAAWLGSLLFALGTAQELAIGQLAFLLGEALGLAACWAGARRRWGPAVLLALACSSASPLAGAFLALGALAWLIGAPSEDRPGAAGVFAAALIPIAGIAVIFPGQGRFPFPFGDFAFEFPAAVAMFLIVPRRHRVLRVGAALYAAATLAGFVVPSPVGGNVGRLGECLAIPLGACVLWPRRRVLLAVLAVPMALWQWTPVWSAISGQIARAPSAHRAYYASLLDFLAANATPAARVEVVPTRFHWEAAYVAPTVPLARGWERQLDIVDDPLFYGGRPLDAARYRGWLIDSGVRFVALPDAPLDFAAAAEARLLDSGVPGLEPVWQDAHWRVYAVDGATGIVSGPARLVRMSGGRVSLDVLGPGTVILRVRAAPHWSVSSGPACVSSVSHGVVLSARAAGTVDLDVTFATHTPRRC
ncbi:MAG TPA: hypothetical protein VN180_02205 [Acidimicrobiia bacterium]|nr:hypothetical protein [Acidimicrobiia bacterium]